ncbi:Ctr copper transporter family-domain-containing protein [Pyronema domesticum]|uniref:Copper transport protein n=1 Tax=Pyronema omphalodes (strain CBS 100304) TaxID=1076935 RepID=U4KW66_PYROM|nr:Ctr copper transporter family-domain-containing protein [Pyronema domesticum]CCX05918.1 Similar to Copper transport protein CTR1; acc. no. P49573 [Pyronema omphalodes CBS 100304]
MSSLTKEIYDHGINTPSGENPTNAVAAAISNHSMPSVFILSPINRPLLLLFLTSRNPVEVMMFWLLIFGLAVGYRAMAYARHRLETRYWNPPGFRGSPGNQSFFFSPSLVVQRLDWSRDLKRAGMEFLTQVIGYLLMLIAMSFVVPWFFAIVLGLATAEFFFARLTAV